MTQNRSGTVFPQSKGQCLKSPRLVINHLASVKRIVKVEAFQFADEFEAFLLGRRYGMDGTGREQLKSLPASQRNLGN